MTRAPRRVLVLGGGCAGVAAALRLTSTAARRERLRVTLVQQGWRLGGKGASGRDMARGARVEEHGLHLWMGWYRHAFALARETLAEWDAPPGCPLRDCETAFAPVWALSLAERHRGALGAWHLRFPPRPGRPWDANGAPLDLTRLAADSLGFLGALLLDGDAGVPGMLARPGTALRQAATLARLARVVWRGWARDVRPWGEAGWARIDHLDLREWLALHRARDAALLDAPPIRALYDLAFAYPGGVRAAEEAGGPPAGRVAAGAALRTILHVALAYRGAPLYRLPFGMGDTLFSPALDVLRARGVDVRLYHRVRRLELSGDARLVDRVHLVRQAAPRVGTGDGRVRVRGLPAWPNEPPWHELAGGDRLRAAGARFESAAYIAGDACTLERAADFDDVVLALPAPALPDVVAELVARHEPWRAMMASSATVATRAAQLWLDRAPAGAGRVLVGHAPPLASHAEMGEVLAAEAWEGAGRPRGLVYLCDALPDGEGEAEARASLERWLDERAPTVWPGFARGWLVGEPYVRANVEPWDRYVLSLPGSTAHRLGPAESSVANLALAGDWTRTTINGGSVEAAAESGVAAADWLAAAAGA